MKMHVTVPRALVFGLALGWLTAAVLAREAHAPKDSAPAQLKNPFASTPGSIGDHGSTDGEIFTVIKQGVGPQFFMAPFDGRISGTDIWGTINHLSSLAKKKMP